MSETSTTAQPSAGDMPAAGYEPVCELHDLPIGRAAAALVGERRVALVRLADREVYAIDDICSHGAVSLSEGDVVGCELECWMHGSRFNLRTGVPSCPPATTRVPVYAVRLVGDTVYVTATPTPAEELPA
ncbi:MAG TPA: non-heme iron oxygenase ferredoxin subunit [Dermatophilaceae bacterium]|jgi:3-phenylpropionate/trans-cinnamate dioxygenase ferredoxin subunit|nr:non-heme iron oxygenase ferredoxin subunit [Dermatophilaceae bacterium]HMT89206.1 non-heme iron oxygenase ferredoxin subunit [Dermatophilaceae bacterium]